jgi:two-component system, cell cycle sensor histidine kinase and response regulator CckA
MPRKIPEKEVAAAEPLHILIADDDPDDVDLCLRALAKSGLKFHADTAFTKDDFARKLREQSVDVVLSDYRMKGWTGMDALAMVKETRFGVPLILMTGALGDETAVECIKLGVTDYVLKHQIARLPLAIRRAQEARILRAEEINVAVSLRESEEHYRTLVQNAPEAIVVFDVNKHTFVECNDKAIRLFGRSREELMRSGSAALSPPFQPDGRLSEDVSNEQVNRALEGDTPPFEWVCRNSRGEEFPAEVHLVRLPSATRMLVRGSITDISERKHSEKAIRESEARYRALVDHAAYGIFWASEPEGRLLHANPALAEMLGYASEAELLGVEFTETLYRDPADQAKLVSDYMSHGRAEGTVEWKRKDGKIITVRMNGRKATYPDGKSECAEVTVEDITERVALQKQLVQAQKFEAIGQLAGGIAHDFNNMIGAILGWAEIGMDESGADSRLRRYFEKVDQQGKRAAALTRQLLAFARRQILEPRSIDLNQTAVETLGLLEKIIGSNIEIKATLAPDLAVVRADPTQIEQVVMNLCINARDAMPSGGSLTIATSNVRLDEQFCALQPLARPGDYAILAVTDTGTGMDSATLEHIFEPFFTTKELGKGTGLGLATVYGVVRQHGGFLHVYSEPGRGSTFRVYFPASNEVAAPRERAEEAGPVRGGSETILVAEDHEGLGQLALETLTGLGYQVMLATDGEQAIQDFRANRERIALVILDVMLPKLGGPAIYERIRKEKPDLPVIFATGYSPDIAELQKVQLEGLAVLQKPYSPRDLARKVRETIDQHALQHALATAQK